MMDINTMSPTKPSGIPWLGEVPAHWVVKRLKYLASTNDEALPVTAVPTQEIVYVEIGGVDAVEGIVAKEQLVLEDAPSRARRLVRHGDTVVSTVRTYLRAIAPIRDPEPNLVVSTGFAVIRPRELDPDYLGYALRAPYFIETIVSRSTGVSYPGINASEIGNIEVAYPPLPEQRAIAAFLDERTARIDALVARKRRLVQLLKEKRQALITRAVTRGLDPKAKMKESGVPWLGEVPEGWEVKPLRNVATFQNGISAGADYFGTGYPFVNYKDVYQWPSLPEQVEGLANSTDIDQERYSVREGDIFFTRTSETNEEIGFASTCLKKMEHATFSGFLIRVRPHRGLLAPNFSKHFFRSDIHRAFFVKEMNLVTRASLGQELLKRLPVLLPPVNEQVAIAEFLDDRLNRLDALVTKVEQAVERLQEYRTALISAAVTGKVPPTRGATADKG